MRHNSIDGDCELCAPPHCHSDKIIIPKPGLEDTSVFIQAKYLELVREVRATVSTWA
jgi:hypothetical protein